MVMPKYFFSKCPSEGPTSQVDVNEILNKIQQGQISLMTLFWINSFQHYYAFQIPLIHKWMLAQLSPYMNDESISQIPFSSFNAQDKTWYFYRQDKENLFGPMTLSEILKMKKKNYIFNNDFCFSFKEESFFYASELPEIQISPKEKDQPFYFQRRSRRFNELHQCEVSIILNGQNSKAELIDFSENGAAISSSLCMQLEQVLEINILLIDPISKQQKSFSHKAVIKSIRNEKDLFRYGLFLLDKANRTLDQIKNEKKAA